MAKVRDRSEEAHRRAVQTDIAGIAQFLEETLGRQLVTYMVGVADAKTVGRWSEGETHPRSAAEKRLRGAYQIFQLLQTEESPHTVRAWFIGLNPQLEDTSPAEAIREGQLRDVLVAAKAYIAGG